jgi:NAD(P)-dependent dehydrogenase (short-subunit alcohol dehydrogenase family)
MTTIGSLALITGATGGIGLASARSLGADRAVFLTDVDQHRLDEVAKSLVGSGVRVAGAVAGDLADAQFVETLLQKTRAAGPIGAVLHAAGLSPALADAAAILHVNLIATERLLLALETNLEPGMTCVLIASIAAHIATSAPAIEALCEKPLDADFEAKILPLFATGSNLAGEVNAAGSAYTYSKLAVLRMAEARAATWGKSGARIISISPGMIDTPMGRREVDTNPQSAMMVDFTPLGWGQPDDIAQIAAFACSARARFLTGCDIRVDGGLTASVQSFLKVAKPVD